MRTKLVRGTYPPYALDTLYVCRLCNLGNKINIRQAIEIAAVTLSSIHHPMLRVTECTVKMVQYSHMTGRAQKIE